MAGDHRFTLTTLGVDGARSPHSLTRLLPGPDTCSFRSCHSGPTWLKVSYRAWVSSVVTTLSPAVCGSRWHVHRISVWLTLPFSLSLLLTYFITHSQITAWWKMMFSAALWGWQKGREPGWPLFASHCDCEISGSTCAIHCRPTQSSSLNPHALKCLHLISIPCRHSCDINTTLETHDTCVQETGTLQVAVLSPWPGRWLHCTPFAVCHLAICTFILVCHLDTNCLMVNASMCKHVWVCVHVCAHVCVYISNPSEPWEQNLYLESHTRPFTSDRIPDNCVVTCLKLTILVVVLALQKLFFYLLNLNVKNR
jgi:hypothetical protein